MTPGEIARRLEDVVREVRNISDQCLRRDVFEVTNRALEARVETIERERIGARKLVYALAGTFIVSTGVQVLVTLLTK